MLTDYVLHYFTVDRHLELTMTVFVLHIQKDASSAKQAINTLPYSLLHNLLLTLTEHDMQHAQYMCT